MFSTLLILGGGSFMKLSKMPKEELELYSYVDLTKKILEEEKKPLNTMEIFKKICSLLGMSDTELENKIGSFYTSLTTDKNFVMLADGNWDLRDHHPVDMILDEDEEEIEEDYEEEIEEEILEPDEDTLEPDEDDDMDDLEDEDELTIIDEEELEEE